MDVTETGLVRTETPQETSFLFRVALATGHRALHETLSFQLPTPDGTVVVEPPLFFGALDSVHTNHPVLNAVFAVSRRRSSRFTREVTQKFYR